MARLTGGRTRASAGGYPEFEDVRRYEAAQTALGGAQPTGWGRGTPRPSLRPPLPAVPATRPAASDEEADQPEDQRGDQHVPEDVQGKAASSQQHQDEQQHHE